MNYKVDPGVPALYSNSSGRHDGIYIEFNDNEVKVIPGAIYTKGYLYIDNENKQVLNP